MSTVAVVRLGYVGLPLAVAFGKKFRTIGFDLSAEKVENYRRHVDPMGEVSSEEFRAAARLTVTTDPAQLAAADIIVVAVPTPVDAVRQPDFGPLVGASTTVGKSMKNGATVVYESTVYPGATEEVCIPVLEKNSGKTWLKDFNVGYSPERINPGDKEHRLETIVKVVAGDTPETLDKVASLYRAIVEAGGYPVSRIKVAEAAKVNVLGLTFKEDVPDLRNSHVIDVINELKSFGIQVFVHDPVPDPEAARHEYGLELVPWEKLPVADAMVVAVAHRQFRNMGAEMLARKIVKSGSFIDVKSQFDRKVLAAAGLHVWRV